MPTNRWTAESEEERKGLRRQWGHNNNNNTISRNYGCLFGYFPVKSGFFQSANRKLLLNIAETSTVQYSAQL